MTKRQFIADEARRIGVAPRWFADNGTQAVPCDHREDGPRTESGQVLSCKQPECPGWRWVATSGGGR